MEVSQERLFFTDTSMPDWGKNRIAKNTLSYDLGVFYVLSSMANLNTSNSPWVKPKKIYLCHTPVV
jgi:hypothetical protein